MYMPFSFAQPTFNEGCQERQWVDLTLSRCRGLCDSERCQAAMETLARFSL